MLNETNKLILNTKYRLLNPISQPRTENTIPWGTKRSNTSTVFEILNALSP
jgi:hypothetical protein